MKHKISIEYSLYRVLLLLSASWFMLFDFLMMGMAVCSGGFRKGRWELNAPWLTVKIFLNVDHANHNTQ